MVKDQFCSANPKERMAWARAPPASVTVTVSPLGQGWEGVKSSVLPCQTSVPGRFGSIDSRWATLSASIGAEKTSRSGVAAGTSTAPSTGEVSSRRGVWLQARAVRPKADRRSTIPPVIARRSFKRRDIG